MRPFPGSPVHAHRARKETRLNVRNATQQIVAREPRERLCHEALLVQGGYYRAAA